MSTQQAFVEGFVKRAAEHGFNAAEAHYMLKVAEDPAAEVNWMDRLQGMGNRVSSALTSAGKGMEQFTQGAKSLGGGWNDLKESFNVASGKQEPPTPKAPEGAKMPSVSGNPELAKLLNPSSSPASNTPTGFRLGLGGDGKVSLNDPEGASSAAGFRLGLGGDNKVSLTENSSPIARPTPITPSPAAISSLASSPAAIQTADGPSNAQLAKIMGSYDPRSRLDQAKAQKIRELYSQGVTSPNAIYADKGYSGITPQSLRSGGNGELQRPQPLQQAPRPAGPASLYGGPAGVDSRAFNNPQRLSYR
jgi:hypothetical protein